MAYQEVKTTSYGKRVGNSFKGIGGGLLLLVAGTVLLWWNEGRAVKTDKMLNEAQKACVEMQDPSRRDPALDGELVCATAVATTRDSLIDTRFGFGATAISLQRMVEYYQWVEHAESRSEDKLGGKEVTTTTYTYTREWVSSPVRSSDFKDPEYQDKNTVLAMVEPQDLWARDVTFGAYRLNESLVRGITSREPVQLSLDEKVLSDLKDASQSGNMLYIGHNPSSPEVGDVRITWEKIVPARVTIISQVDGDSFKPFKAKNGKTFQTLVMGRKDASEIFDSEHGANKFLMWVLRILGVILVCSGLKGIFGFLETLLKVVPFLANILGWGVGVVCTVVGVVWSLVVIALAWLFYRPVLGIALLVLAGLLIWFFAFRGKGKLVLLSLLLVCGLGQAREKERLDKGWEFAFGNASSPALDFGCGTEYFTYLTKAASIHNEGPYSPKFDKSKWPAQWVTVDLPHDWVVDLPYAPEASHSHGYKTVGYKYPQTSVGWYRKTFTIPAEDEGKHIWVRFDGIFRSSRVWLNGFYLGHEESGYATRIYDISEYLNYGGENLLTVRVDASLEEGWFYEGAGIYRHVWLEKADPLHVAPFGTFVHSWIEAPYDVAEVSVETTVRNRGQAPAKYYLHHQILDADGGVVAAGGSAHREVYAKADSPSLTTLTLVKPHLWSPDDPYLYTVVTEVISDGKTVDTYRTRMGVRSARFDPDQGFLLNGKRLEIKGVNMHQDHPGVGAGIPDALQVYRIQELKKLGANAYRSSHNPMTPEMLDVCDSLGMLVMEENRLMGVNEEHIHLLRRMIQRDRNHPSIILWSVGNEEWGIEWNDKGRKIAESMREYCHRADPTRPMAVATSSGPNIVIPADVAGYNYMMQNPIDRHRADYPTRSALGSEETTGCGTRGVYFDSEGRMASLNRIADKDGRLNRIGRGWQFYAERPWLGGLFYWTGFDYRGEPNPLSFPATGSQFGILDYCGFPKDEAWYLKSWWTDEPVLHILPHWNLAGHEGEKISIWVYSNCDEVELLVNGKKLGKRQKMPAGGHLEWEAVYKPGKVVARGYKNGKRILTETVQTTGPAARLALEARTIGDVTICKVSVLDGKGRFVPDACIPLQLSVEGDVRILGVGNGDSAFRARERPEDPSARTFQVDSFNGLAQVLLQGSGSLTVSARGLASASVVAR